MLRMFLDLPRRTTSQRTTTPSLRAVVFAAVLTGCVGGLGGCASGRIVEVPAADAIRVPTFATVPEDLSRSPQLQALQARETAGLDASSASANGALLADALAALAARPDAPERLSRVSIYDDTVNLAYEQGGISGRSVNALYQPGDGPPADNLYVGDPTFDDAPTYDIGVIDPAVPTALIRAIETRVPNARVTRLDLEIARSYGFGLVWTAEVEDARGSLATVFADTDGAIVAVDAS